MKTRNLFLLLALNFFLPVFSVMADEEDSTVTLSKNLTVVFGGGGNSGILVTDKAVLVIDTKMGEEAKKLYDLVKSKAGSKPIIVINTHFHHDHADGNYLYKGSKIYMGHYTAEQLKENVKPEDMPTDFVNDSLTLNLGNETVQILNMGQSHTWQDLVVYLKENKVLFTGDLVFYKNIPFVMEKSGADVNKWQSNLARIIKRTDYKTIVPGHGEIGGRALPAALQQYFQDMKTAVRDPSVKQKMIDKYKGWQGYPNMATPEVTMQFIKEHK